MKTITGEREDYDSDQQRKKQKILSGGGKIFCAAGVDLDIQLLILTKI